MTRVFRRRTLAKCWLLFCSLSLAVGCADDPDLSMGGDLAARFDGWEMSTHQLDAEFRRARGDSAFAVMTESDRREFAELLLHKEILVRLAEEECPVPDQKRRRLNRVLFEKNALRHLFEVQSLRPNPNPQYFDSLLSAADLRFETDQFDVVANGFAAFWDSVQVARSEGAKFDVLEIRPPLWRFQTPASDAPLFFLHGEAHSVRDYVRSLSAIDVDYWPTSGDSMRISHQIQQRVRRFLFLGEAEQSGVLAQAEFVAKMERVRERHLLEQFRDRVVRPRQQLSEQELREYFRSHRDFYVRTSDPDTPPSFDDVRDRVERDAIEDATNREIDRLIEDAAKEWNAKVFL